jgi:UDP-glucose 4-epimerase
VEDPELARDLVVGAEVIFHQAALNLLRSVESPARDLEVNAVGTLNLLLAMKEAGGEKVMVFASTGSVYGEPQYNPQDEGHPLQPVSPYGVSKLAAEHYVLLWNRLFGARTVALRYYNVYGPRQNYGSKGGVVGIFIDRVLHGQPPVIEGTGDQERCFTFVGDVVRANLLAATTETARGRVYNIGTTEVTTIRELADMVLEIGRSKLKPASAPRRVGDINMFRPDIARAAEYLGYRPNVKFREGLRQTVDWFVETGRAPRPGQEG